MLGAMQDWDLLVTHVIDHAAREASTREIVTHWADGSETRTDWAGIRRDALKMAQALEALGIQKGDRVASLAMNHSRHLVSWYGVAGMGGVLHTINPRLFEDQLEYIANHAEDRFLVVDDTLLPLLGKFVDECNFEKIFVVDHAGKEIPEGYERYEDLIDSAGDVSDWTPPEADENDAIGMCYTSGTTGRPKGVVYSHRATVLHSFASAMIDTLALSQHDTLLPVVPMFHANAWGLPFTSALTGAKQVHPGPFLDPPSLLDLYVKEEVNVSAGVPTIWLGIQQAIAENPDKWDYKKPMRMIVGGSAAPESMIRAMDKIGMRVIHAWGMTETTPLGTVATLKKEFEDLSEDAAYEVRAKQGIPAPFVDIRAVDEDGEVAWDGESMGELQVRGPWVAASYHGGEDDRDSWTDDGWFRTGDVVTIDKYGYVKITDRTKDLIKSGGEWISSVELENALMGHPSVLEAAVIGVPHEKWVERPLAVVVPKPGQTIDEDALRAHLEGKFAKFWIPDAFVTRDEIPRTSTGKFMKATLRDELAGK